MTSSAAATGPTGERRTIVNFGGNIRWAPLVYQPANDQEVLQILRKHARETVRPIGALHSWSETAGGADVTLDMSRFDEVAPLSQEGRSFVRVGAGCRLATLLDKLHAAAGSTLPTIGVITQQTLSGIISTATHGSGAPSVSHFVNAVRVAAYDASGEPKIFEYRDGEELRAARCALGCMGVVLSMDLPIVPKYGVEETMRHVDSIEEALRFLRDYPLTQFALLPHGWKYIVYQRRVVAGSPPDNAGLKEQFFRLYNFLSSDVLFHLLVKTVLKLGPGAVRGLMKTLPHIQLANVTHVDESTHVLTMQHHLFRHEEMELFVPEAVVMEAEALLRSATAIFDGTESSLPAAIETKLRDAGLYDELMQKRGTYVHHYPVLFRHVLPEDALISMVASASAPYFSISIFTYYPPSERGGYYAFCSWLARSMHALFGARLHWGKHFPLGVAEMTKVYPALGRFRDICRRTDPSGVFTNAYTKRVLGLSR
jgi:L-gulono-1,4-lactone dehydrogenase